MGGGFEGGMGGGSGFDSGPQYRPTEVSSKKRTPPSTEKKGMQLGKGRKKDVLEKLMDEGEVVEAEITQTAKRSAPVVPGEPVSILIDEKLVAALSRDGGVEVLEVNGVMTLEVSTHDILGKNYTIPIDPSWWSLLFINYGCGTISGAIGMVFMLVSLAFVGSF